ncbi:hypothetical protein C8R41DRAFT_921635 [Lentinula lateritia]|uniref:Uncharacterized protein n=1 Tax=Lentinula lateritia TaxID=40482 RepID=A0ABQ8VAU0_9AGAR|nr:hypothetical protein C8R41DRAFT_921635 [Lentinula lateritia]
MFTTNPGHWALVGRRVVYSTLLVPFIAPLFEVFLMEEENGEEAPAEVSKDMRQDTSKQKTDTEITANTNPGNQHPAEHDATQVPKDDPMGIPALTILLPPEPLHIRHSKQGHIPSHRLLESEEYETHKREAQIQGEEWTQDTETLGQPLALITQSLYSFAATAGDLWVPQSFKQAMKCADLWRELMKREFATLVTKECWDLVPLPPDANLTGGQWTYAIKFNAC